jgi:hypothetical protein
MSRIHGSIKATVLALSFALIGGCETAPAVSAADMGLQLENARMQRSVAAEQHGDALAAAGDLNGAVAEYQHALALSVLHYDAGYALGLFDAPADSMVLVPEGVRLTKVNPNGIAYQAGVRSGDVLTAIAGASLAGLSEVEIYDKITDNPFNPPALTVVRDGQTLTIQMPYAGWFLGGDPPFVRAWLPRAWNIVEKEVALYARGARVPPLTKGMRDLGMQAQTAAKNAHTPEEVQNAADWYTLAQFVAPYWSDLLINAALFEKGAGNATDATRSLKLYLTLVPNDAAARAALAQLQPESAAEARLAAWEGDWLDGNGGLLALVRNGNTLTASIGNRPPYIRVVILDDHTAKGNNIVSAENTDLSRFPEPYRRVVLNCFNGHMESAVTLTLSDDKQRMTEQMSDIQVDPSSCAVVSNVTNTVSFHRR